MAQIRQIAADLLDHRFVGEAAKVVRRDHDLAFGKAQHIAQFPLPENRHQRISDGANAGTGQMHGIKLPPIGQLQRDHIARFHAQVDQGQGQATGQPVQLTITERCFRSTFSAV